MKKELFNRIVAYMSGLKAIHKHTTKENFESYCYLMHDGSSEIQKVKDMLKNNTPPESIAYQIPRALTTYTTITYDEAKDKISVGEFEVGWMYAGRKGRWYPMSKNKPILCYSKMIYNFHFRNKKPRVMNAMAPALWSQPYQRIMMMMMDVEYMPSIAVPARYAFNTKSDWELLYNYTKIKIPKALFAFQPDAVHKLIKVLRNPNELSSLCMYIAKNDYLYERHYVSTGRFLKDDNILAERRTDPNLYMTLAQMMLGDPTKDWLINDYINDHVSLKRKMSLKISSEKRIADEHRKMTKEIMIKGIKEIKVKEHYVEMFKTFPIEGAELIQDKTRLLRESVDQDHCVATYGNQINSGVCCIISIPYNGRQWTLQINANERDKNLYAFTPVQCRGYRNEDRPQELWDKIQRYCTSISPAPFTATFASVADDLPF